MAWETSRSTLNTRTAVLFPLTEDRLPYRNLEKTPSRSAVSRRATVGAALLGEINSGIFGYINGRLSLHSGQPTEIDFWPSLEDDERANESLLVSHFPAASSLAFKFDRPLPTVAVGRKPLMIRTTLRLPRDNDVFDGLSWNGSRAVPDRIAYRRTYRLSLIPIFDSAPSDSADTALTSANYPPRWASFLCGARFADYASERGHVVTDRRGRVIWNPADPLVRLAEPDWAWAERFRNDPDPQSEAELRADAGKSAAWLLLPTSLAPPRFWPWVLNTSRYRRRRHEADLREDTVPRGILDGERIPWRTKDSQ